MLIAAKRGKLRIHFDNHKKLVEDEITSTIFGPLSYFSADDVWNLFESLIEPKLEKKELWPNGKTSLKVSFEFWPKLQNSEDGEREPDVIIKFRNGHDLLLNLVIEAKWGRGSGQSSTQDSTGVPSQLADQWRRISAKDRANTLHIYLAWDKEKVTQEFDAMFDPMNGLDFRELKFKKDDWYDRLISITWGEMAYMIQSLKKMSYSSPVHNWLEEVTEFLDKFGFSKFNGFQEITMFNVPLLHQKMLFWRHFDGFNIFEDIEVGDCDKKSSLFYSDI